MGHFIFRNDAVVDSAPTTTTACTVGKATAARSYGRDAGNGGVEATLAYDGRSGVETRSHRGSVQVGIGV